MQRRLKPEAGWHPLAESSCLVVCCLLRGVVKDAHICAHSHRSFHLPLPCPQSSSLARSRPLTNHVQDYVYPYLRPPSSPHKNRWLGVVTIERISPPDCLSVPWEGLQGSISPCLPVLSQRADLPMAGAWGFSSSAGHSEPPHKVRGRHQSNTVGDMGAGTLANAVSLPVTYGSAESSMYRFLLL